MIDRQTLSVREVKWSEYLVLIDLEEDAVYLGTVQIRHAMLQHFFPLFWSLKIYVERLMMSGQVIIVYPDPFSASNRLHCRTRHSWRSEALMLNIIFSLSPLSSFLSLSLTVRRWRTLSFWPLGDEMASGLGIRPTVFWRKRNTRVRGLSGRLGGGEEGRQQSIHPVWSAHMQRQLWMVTAQRRLPCGPVGGINTFRTERAGAIGSREVDDWNRWLGA